MSRERSSTQTTPTKTPIDSKHLDPNDLVRHTVLFYYRIPIPIQTVIDGAVRSIESFLATEVEQESERTKIKDAFQNARDAHLKIRVGFDIIPPEGKDYDYKR